MVVVSLDCFFFRKRVTQQKVVVRYSDDDVDIFLSPPKNILFGTFFLTFLGLGSYYYVSSSSLFFCVCVCVQKESRFFSLFFLFLSLVLGVA